jgi:hypothetical protein
MGGLIMGNLNFNMVLTGAAFLTLLVSIRRERQYVGVIAEMRQSQQELLGEIQKVLAKVSGDIDRLRHLIPDEQSSEARDITEGLVGAIDQIILITRGDWAG